jgi:nucleoside-specific outer membrane channel protein Tsx
MKIKLNGMLIVACLGVYGQAMAADFSDTFVGYRYGPRYAEPANKNNVPKNIFSLGHFSSYAYGTNAFNVDMLLSHSNDPAADSTRGATEIYATYRTQLQYGKVTGTPIAFGPISDLALTAGFDFNTKNNVAGPEKRAFVIGPTFKFNVPGILDLSLLYYKETNHKGVPGTPEPDMTFDNTAMVAATWNFPINSGGALPGVFKGLASYIFPKGKDYNHVETAGETLIRTALMFDIGNVVLHRKNAMYAGVGYEFWKNKFGNQPSSIGSQTSTPTINFEAHF